MRKSRIPFLVVVWLSVAATRALCAPSASESFCREAGLRSIPERPAGAEGGAQLAARLARVDGEAREQMIRGELLAGNIPQFLRELRPVVISPTRSSAATSLTLCVMPDYLALGSNADYILMPMRLSTALAVAHRYGLSLPTSRMVDTIHAQSDIRLDPQPLPAGPAMRSSAYLLAHNERVREQRNELGAESGWLISGDKKDLVLSNRLWREPERVAIYGWHTLQDKPIQSLSTVHGWRYVDYSHGVRLVGLQILLDGHRENLLDALASPRLASVLSSEGVIERPRELVQALERRRFD